MHMRPCNQKGSALILALIFVLVLSVMGASLMFLSQSETWSSMNYRLMTQARYGAEAGVHAAASYLANQYPPPGGTGDPLSNYVYEGVSPVTFGGSPVKLSTLSGVTSNYPVQSVKDAFIPASSGPLTAGNTTVKYSAYAKLMSMKQLTQTNCGKVQPVAQVWRIKAHGDIDGVRNAQAEVISFLEAPIVPCYNYAAFSTNSGCGSVSFSGGGTIDSYDSSTVAGGFVTTQAYDGNLGSNGNLNTAPNTVVAGTFSSPDTGVGPCSAGGVDALSGNGGAVTGCETAAQLSGTCGAPLVQLSQTLTFPPPCAPVTSSCATNPTITWPAGVTLSSVTSPNGGSIQPGSYGDISIGGNNALILNPYVDPVTHVCSSGTYYINSISANGNGSVTIAPCPPTSTTPGAYQPVIVNIVGENNSAPIALAGNGINNPTLNPSLIQIEYAGTGTVNLAGNGSSAAVLYAPNAPVTLNGGGANGAWWGSLIGATVHANGGASIHYDRRLANELLTVGNWTLDTFTWSKY